MDGTHALERERLCALHGHRDGGSSRSRAPRRRSAASPKSVSSPASPCTRPSRPIRTRDAVKGISRRSRDSISAPRSEWRAAAPSASRERAVLPCFADDVGRGRRDGRGSSRLESDPATRISIDVLGMVHQTAGHERLRGPLRRWSSASGSRRGQRGSGTVPLARTIVAPPTGRGDDPAGPVQGASAGSELIEDLRPRGRARATHRAEERGSRLTLDHTREPMVAVVLAPM